MTVPFSFSFQNLHFLELKLIELTYVNEMSGLKPLNSIETKQNKTFHSEIQHYQEKKTKQLPNAISLFLFYSACY